MKRVSATAASLSPDAVSHVGIAELRKDLAKYLRLARGGSRVVVKDRGKAAYVLSRFEETAPPSVLGVMRERTEVADGAVPRSPETWTAGDLP